MPREKMSSNFHDRLASSAASQMQSVVGWIEQKCRQVFRVGAYTAGSVAFVNMLIVWTIVLYCILYWMFIPAVMQFESPLYFDVDPAYDGPVRFDLPQKVPFEFPVAKVVFTSYDQQWVEVRENPQNKTTKRVYPGIHDNPLYLGEIYDISVHFTLPDTPQNLDIGMFMVETELLFATRNEDAPQKPLVKSRRPVSLPFRTWLSTVTRDVLLLPVRTIFGWYPPERSVTLVTIEDWREDWESNRLPTGVKVTVSDPRLNIGKSWVRFDLKLWGFRYWMYYWFWTTFVFTVAMLSWMQSGIALSALLYRYIVPGAKKRVKFKFPEIFSDEDEDKEEFEEEEEEDIEEKNVEQGVDELDEEEEVEEEESVEGDDEIPPSAFEDHPPDTSAPAPGARFMMSKQAPSESSGGFREEPTDASSAGYQTPPEVEPPSPRTDVAVEEEEKRHEESPVEDIGKPPMTTRSGEDIGSPSSGERPGGSPENDMVLVGHEAMIDDFVV